MNFIIINNNLSQIADEDGNGMLSKTEIFNLCKICLSKFISSKEKDLFLDNLCDYFTKLIFGAMNIDIEEEIPLKTIKEAILSVNSFRFPQFLSLFFKGE